MHSFCIGNYGLYSNCYFPLSSVITLWLPVGLTLLPSFDRGTRRPCVAAAFRLTLLMPVTELVLLIGFKFV